MRYESTVTRYGKRLLANRDVYTLLRLPTGLFYAQEMIEDLEGALEQLRAIAGDLGAKPGV